MKKTDAAKRWLSALLCLALAVPAGGWGAPAQAESAAELNPPGTPTVEEIRQAFEDYRYEELISSRITYAEEPRVSPAQSLKAGALSQETIRDALDGVNLVRSVVGLDEVSEDPLYSEAAQHGAVLLTYRNNGLSHTPPQPAGVSDEFYELAYEGTSKSNISWMSGSWTGNFFQTTRMYMSDAGSNFSTVGHRRWLIYPNLQSVGFGYAQDGSVAYSATYVIEGAPRGGEEPDLAWPAPEMPLELFADEDPWSINLGSGYDDPRRSEVRVTLSERGGKTWTFHSGSPADAFTVNNAYYGQGRCIIFQPTGISYDDGDIFDVRIEGLSGTSDVLEYSVHFFEATSEKPASQPEQQPEDEPEREPEREPEDGPEDPETIPQEAGLVQLVEDVSVHEFEIPAGARAVSSDTGVAAVTVATQGGARVCRIQARSTGACTVTVTGDGSPYQIDVFVLPKGGSITLDTVNYRMDEGDLYDIGVTITDGEGNRLSGAAVQQMYRNGVLRVSDSRTGSVVHLQQLPNGNFRVTGKNPGTCYIVYEIVQEGQAWTHASVKLDVIPGQAQGGVATRDTSWWPAYWFVQE